MYLCGIFISCFQSSVVMRKNLPTCDPLSQLDLNIWKYSRVYFIQKNIMFLDISTKKFKKGLACYLNWNKLIQHNVFSKAYN